MNVEPIKSEQDYDQALERLNEIFFAPENTPESDEVEVLSILIEAYDTGASIRKVIKSAFL